ncbi:MAG: hypothetical protein ACREV4_07925 [Gammaproteobacteria bacterium]
MKDEPIPDEQHITRLCKTGGLNDEQTRPITAAFMPREGEEYLSVNWVEFFCLPSREDGIDQIRQCLNTKFELRPSYRLALLNVGELIARVKADTRRTVIPEVVHRPDEPKPDPSHSGIFNLPHQDKEKMLTVANALVESVLDVVPASNVI